MSRAAAALVALLALALAGWLAWHHPLSPIVALAALLLAVGFTAADPVRWPLWVLPLLPLIGLMPWTGWLVVEELDLLLLAVAAGGYARWAVAPLDRTEPPVERSGAWLWLAPVLASTGLSCLIGLSDAGGLTWGWWQGYREPLNAVRLAKPALALLVLLPLMLRAQRQRPEAWSQALQGGFVGLLAAVALCVVWERAAYTGLLNFSTDYRATALFWEMHVGGAALDAALVLSLPFAALALQRARAPATGLLSAAVLLLGAYAALTTFSRIVYLAAPLALVTTAWLASRQRGSVMRADASPGRANRMSGTRALLGWLVVVVGLSLWLFPAGGYRSLLALLGAVVLQLPLLAHTRPLSARQWGLGLAGAGLGVALVAAAALLLPKGAYAAYAAAAVLTGGLLLGARQGRASAGVLLVASYGTQLAALVAVGVHWGGDKAWAPGLGAAGLLALVWMAASGRRRVAWPASWRWQAQAAMLLVVVAPVVGVFLGGDYMAQRFNQTADDRVGRLAHWQRSLDWLRGTDWLAGKGLGRYAVHFSLSGSRDDQVGDYRLAEGPADRGRVLLQTAGMHPDGGWFRVSQRLPRHSRGPYTVTLDVQTAEAAQFQVDVCEKHLLYVFWCTDRLQAVPRPGPEWQTMRIDLPGADAVGGSVWAPKWLVFSIAVVNPNGRLNIDRVDVRDGSGRSVLANGDFEQGMARWFITSDRQHLPWHAKNLGVHLVFEQGLLGLAAWLAAVAVAVWRLSLGAARGHPMAPALAGALVGVMTVGAVDSLLDMPRIAFLMLMLLAVALTLSAGPRRERGA